VRYEETEDGIVRPATKPPQRVRRKPFARELALLRELGLR
jgi:hypothetical protein